MMNHIHTLLESPGPMLATLQEEVKRLLSYAAARQDHFLEGTYSVVINCTHKTSLHKWKVVGGGISDIVKPSDQHCG